MTAETDLQALDERLGPARAAYQTLRYEGPAPRPEANTPGFRIGGFWAGLAVTTTPYRRVLRWWAALAVPAAAAVVLLVGTGSDPEFPPARPSLNSVVEQRPLSWRSSLPEGGLAVAPDTPSFSFSIPPRPRRPDESMLLEDTSASGPDTPVVG